MSLADELRRRDVLAVMEIVEEGRRDDPGEGGLPWAVLDGLQRLVPCDADVAFNELDLERRVEITGQELHPTERLFDQNDDGPEHDAFWKFFWDSPSCSYPQRTGDLVSVVRNTDFHPARKLGNDPLYAEYLHPRGMTYGMTVSLPTVPGRTRRVLFRRSSPPDFTERERAAAALLRPHLYELWLDTERRRNGVPHLTRREWEVLHLAAAAHSNADIAARLFISVTTVRKHLEHIFDKLGVRTRTAAAALALPHSPRLDLVRLHGRR